ncbi:MAG: hypothetical protein J5934_07995 [Succinivibrio sp.]|nr:hypothetical protein [Succinivibrio sp.]
MFELENFKEEAITLTKWLVAIPSITGTPGESVVIKAIHEGFKEFKYFKQNPDDLIYIKHADLKNRSLMAFIKAEGSITDTLVLMCSTDTSGNENYGTLKTLAFKSDDLKARLKDILTKQKGVDKDVLAQLDDENSLYGLGTYENKSATGALIVLLKDLSADLDQLKMNILFVCTSNSINSHQGIRESVPYIHDLIRERGLKLKLALNFGTDIIDDDDKNSLKLYTANMGQVETCFYILGHGANNKNPFSGFSPALIASNIIQKMELNPSLTKDISKRPLIPTFRYFNCYSSKNPNSPDSVQLGFTLPFVNLNLNDLLEIMKLTAAEAIEDAALFSEDRESAYMTLQDQEYQPENRNAEIISYADLFYRASRHYKGDLASAIDGLLQKCIKEGLSIQSAARSVIERLNDLAKLPRPSIVVYMGSNFIPQQRISSSNTQDRELYIRINEAVEAFNQSSEKQITIEDEYPPSDSCFLRPIGIDAALKTLQSECPVPVNTFYNLGAPAVTLCIKGKDLYKSTEHISTEMFDVIPEIISSLNDCLCDTSANSRETADDSGNEDSDKIASDLDPFADSEAQDTVKAEETDPEPMSLNQEKNTSSDDKEAQDKQEQPEKKVEMETYQKEQSDSHIEKSDK